MKRKIHWSVYRNFLTKIAHLDQDWLTPCEYLPYIDAVLGDIDLDPCSTHSANVEFLRAKKIYTLQEDGLVKHIYFLQHMADVLFLNQEERGDGVKLQA